MQILPHLQHVVGPSLEITSLVWAQDTIDQSWRAFASYLDGTVAEVMWKQGCVAHSTDTHGGVAWGLAAAPTTAHNRATSTTATTMMAAAMALRETG